MAWDHFIGHQLQVNIEYFLTNELTFDFNLRYFCFSVHHLTLTEFKNFLEIRSEFTLTFLIYLPNTGETNRICCHHGIV